jgi:Mg-chelatase subunit ChlD
LSRHERFEQVSPEVGVLDEDALDKALSEDAEQTLALLADLSGATDVRLRQLARQLAGRLVVDVARCGVPRARGVGRLRQARADRAEGDLDVDASLEPLVLARAGGGPPPLDQLQVRAWGRHELALCLVIDRSGSMGGQRLATAAVAAAASALRAPDDWSMLAFAERVLVLKAQAQLRPAAAVIDDVLSLRGFGPTDLSLALRTARSQLSLARAGRRLVVLLSDCRATSGADPAIAGAELDELAIVAPADDSEDAAELAGRLGCRWVPLQGAADIPGAFARLIDR